MLNFLCHGTAAGEHKVQLRQRLGGGQKGINALFFVIAAKVEHIVFFFHLRAGRHGAEVVQHPGAPGQIRMFFYLALHKGRAADHAVDLFVRMSLAVQGSLGSAQQALSP